MKIGFSICSRNGIDVSADQVFVASRTMCGSSGRIIFRIASSTAARNRASPGSPFADQTADGPTQQTRRTNLGIA